MCISLATSLKHFFISIDDEKGDSFTKRMGRRSFIITGLALMIIGTLALATIYGAFTGIAGFSTLAQMGMIGGYTVTFTGLSLFILGIIRVVLAKERAKRIALGTDDSSEDATWRTTPTSSSSSSWGGFISRDLSPWIGT